MFYIELNESEEVSVSIDVQNLYVRRKSIMLLIIVVQYYLILVDLVVILQTI